MRLLGILSAAGLRGLRPWAASFPRPYARNSAWSSCCYVSFFLSGRRRRTRYIGDWSSDVCSSDLPVAGDARQRSAIQDQNGNVYCGTLAGVPRDRCSFEVTRGTELLFYAFPNDTHYTFTGWGADRKSVVYGKSVEIGAGEQREKSA